MRESSRLFFVPCSGSESLLPGKHCPLAQTGLQQEAGSLSLGIGGLERRLSPQPKGSQVLGRRLSQTKGSRMAVPTYAQGCHGELPHVVDPLAFLTHLPAKSLSFA